MQPRKLEAEALLQLFENLQGESREQFARAILERTSFFCDVQFRAPPPEPEEEDGDLDEDELTKVSFLVTAGPVKSKFEFYASNFSSALIQPLLTGEDATFTANDWNDYSGIDVEQGLVTFSFQGTDAFLETAVPYASCLPAFQQFFAWKSQRVVKPDLHFVRLSSAQFEEGTLTLSWNSPTGNNQCVSKLKLNPESLRANNVEQWEALVAGEMIDIVVEATDSGVVSHHEVNGQMVPWDNYRPHIFRGIETPGEERGIALVSGFYYQEGVVNGGHGSLYQTSKLEPALAQIIAFLRQ